MSGAVGPAVGAEFDAVLRDYSLGRVIRDELATVQINVGKLCNQACHHCHVEAGPKRSEIMERATFERIVCLLDATRRARAVDLTGGAPELNPHFRWFVGELHRREMRVLVRCNLTVIFTEGQADLPEFYRDHDVELVCSLPCYTKENVDQQRGRGVFGQSIDALRRLNALGYGVTGSGLTLDLVYNPVGAFLPPQQSELEEKYRAELRQMFGIEFGKLLTITNMPIKRFAEQLRRDDEYASYMDLLVDNFNPAAAAAVMCRSLVSVGWDGLLYDCDFNQMLEIPCGAARTRTIWDIDSFDDLIGADVATASHCFGCTAGAGSSCGGELVEGDG